MQPRTGWPKASSVRVRRAVHCPRGSRDDGRRAFAGDRCLAHEGCDIPERLAGDDTAVELQVSRRGKGLAGVSIDMFMRCSNGIRELGSLLWTPGLERPKGVRIARDGSFSALFDEPEFPSPFVASEEYWLSGRFIRRGRAARLVVRTRLVGEAGTVCDTGNRPLTARRVRPGTSLTG